MLPGHGCATVGAQMSVFANAQDKAKLIGQLLTYLGCQDVRLESTFGLIPQTNVVHFQPTEEVTQWLQKTW